MKSFFKSIIVLILGLIVFSVTIILGLPLSIVAFCVENDRRDWKKFLLYIWGIIDGFFNSLGYIIHSFTIGYDILANALGGQGLEFIITKERETLLGSGKHTISAAVGGINRKNAMLPNGDRLTRALNWAFNEKDHGEYALRQEELIEEFRKSIPKQRK